MAQRIDLTLDGLLQLLGRIERQELAEGDWAIYGALVLQLITRAQSRQERMAAKLAATGQALPGEVVEGQLAATGPSAALAAGGLDEALGATDVEGAATAGEAKEKRKGHGRKGASAFVKAKDVAHALAAGLLGALCAACGVGRMTRYREKVVIRVVGQPIFAAERHHLEQARCRLCGEKVQAEPSTDISAGIGSSYVVYDWSACAMLCVMHYDVASPFKRLETLHTGWGTPLADANLWQVADKSDDLLSHLYRALELYGIQKAKSLLTDDTHSEVMALRRQIRAEVAALEAVGASTRDVRTGINATGVYLETDAGIVVLFFTGRHHAGEVLGRLLKHRRPAPGSPPLVKVTDGASKNFDHQHRGELVEATCNAHAYLKFHDVKEKHPGEYALAGAVYKAVFDNDDEAKTRRLTPEERMLFHREHSKPLMEKLQAMCVEKLRNKLVEPNSALWAPLSFIVNQWARLTRFYEVPGVPLDTNLMEQGSGTPPDRGSGRRPDVRRITLGELGPEGG